MKIEKMLLIGLCVGLGLLYMQISNLSDYVYQGKMLFGSNVTFQLSDVTWANLPVALREEISLKSTATKVSKSDLLELIAYYQGLERKMKEPTSLAVQRMKEKLAKEGMVVK